MSGATGNALEWALVLLRAPGERYALRQSPLPQGIERLLAIAAGVESEESVAEIASGLGESAARLREAAQFYAREVLFHPHADAYRALGVSSEASTDQIKTHHRLLQLWLHPDRQRNEDDSVFASRVNIAWNRLRNDERRRAYDSKLAEEQEQMPSLRDDIVETRRMVPAWVQAPPVESLPSPLRHRLPVVALCVLCLLLGWLVMRNGEREPEAWVWAEETHAVRDDAATSIDVASSGGDKTAAGRTAPKASRREIKQSPVAALLSHPVKALTAFVGGNRAPPVPVSVPTPMPVPTAARDVPTPPSVVAKDEPVKVSPRLAMVEKPVLPPTIVDTVPARQKPGRLIVAVEETPVQVPAVKSSPPKSSPPKSLATALVTKQPRVRPTPEPIAHAIPASPLAPQPPLPPPTSENAPNLARIQQARQVGAQLLQYLATLKRAPPPIWNNPTIMSSADGLRHDLHARGRARIGVPQWRIGNESAGLTSRYQLDGIEGSEGSGIVTAEMIWRENRWLVIGLSVERTR